MKRRNFIAGTGLSLLGMNRLISQEPSSSEISNKKRSQIINTKVLVVGGGQAGIGAATGASKVGVDTMLIENHGFSGGVAAFSIGMCMNQMRPNEKPHGFVHELLLQKLQNYGTRSVRLSTHLFFANVEYLKAAVLDALKDNMVKLLPENNISYL